MSARRIVEGFDELEDSHSLLALRSEATPIDQLAFSVAKKLSHIALSYASPTEPVDGRPPASLQRLRLPPSGNARTHAPNPRACDQIAPDLSSVAGTPADKRFDNAASDTSKISFNGVHKTGSTQLQAARKAALAPHGLRPYKAPGAGLNRSECRSVAQPGSAHRSGRWGRRFESSHSDQQLNE